MSQRRIDDVINNFNIYFPSIAAQMVSGYLTSDNSLMAVLKDGSKVIFNDKLCSVRNVIEYQGTEEDWKREFANRLATVMEEKGFDQSYLAEVSGISQVSISNYIQRKVIPSGYIVDKLARALDCHITDLVCF